MSIHTIAIYAVFFLLVSCFYGTKLPIKKSFIKINECKSILNFSCGNYLKNNKFTVVCSRGTDISQ